MRQRAKRVNPFLGMFIGLTASQQEIHNLVRSRQISMKRDRQRLGGSTFRLANILKIYDALLANPGVWFESKDLAKVAGLSARHGRRLIQQFAVVKHRYIEAGRKTDLRRRHPWRVRYMPTPHRGARTEE